MRRALALLAVLAAALALPAAALAKEVHFTTPSGNIDCRGGGSSISCEVQKAHWPRVPPRPKDCDLDWVGTQLNLSKGRVTLGSCRGDIGPLCVPSSPGDRCTTRPTAAAWSSTRNGIRCTSRRTGLTCRSRNGEGAGFTAAREGYRIYR